MEKIVIDYHKAASLAYVQLCEQFNILDLGNWMAHGIPRRGEFLNNKYQFHGLGCQVETEKGTCVDFDFGPNGTIGFDAWRLFQYADSQPRFKGVFSDINHLSSLFESVVESKKISTGDKAGFLFFNPREPLDGEKS